MTGEQEPTVVHWNRKATKWYKSKNELGKPQYLKENQTVDQVAQGGCASSVRFSNPTVSSPEKCDLPSETPRHPCIVEYLGLEKPAEIPSHLNYSVTLLSYGYFPNDNIMVTVVRYIFQKVF